MSRVHDLLRMAEEQRRLYSRIGEEEAGEPSVRTQVTSAIPASSTADSVASDAMSLVTATPDPAAVDSVLARCPSITGMPDTSTMLFLGSEERARGTEEFRALRSQLYQLREQQPLRRILVTSSLPHEGRSFIAANLAQVMARQPGCRTLLIDADLRNPSLHLALGASATPGLSQYLLGEAEELAIIQKGQMENLFFVPAGRPVSGQTEIVSNGRLKFLFDLLEPMFEWMVIDSPAATPVSDSGVIANSCDGVLMVVRSDSTPFDVVRKALRKFREQQILGVVLNEIPAKNQLPTRY